MKVILIVTLIVFSSVVFYFFRSRMSQFKVDLKNKIVQGALVVDVRSSQEFSMGHYQGAINIPFDQIEKRINEFGAKSKPIVVYCASGGRSTIAKNKLISLGYSDITNAGGLSSMPSR